MRQTNRYGLHVIHVFLALFLVLSCPVLAAGYSDPQNRFSLETPRDWQVRTHEDGVPEAVLEALAGHPSLTILSKEVADAETLAMQPANYERIVGAMDEDIIVVKMNEESVEIAGHPAVQRTYVVIGQRGTRARIFATYIKVGSLSLSITATASERGFSRIEPLFSGSLQTLRFSSSLTEAGGVPPSPAKSRSSARAAERQEIEEAFRQGAISREEYVRRKARLAFDEATPESPETQESHQLAYRVQPGNEFTTHIVMAGRMVTEDLGQGGGAGSENALKYELESVQSVLPADKPDTFITRITTKPENVVILVDGIRQDAGLGAFPETAIEMTRQGDIIGLDDRAQRHEASAEGGLLTLMGVRNSFPRLPDRAVRVGERWDLLPSHAEEGFEGSVHFIGLQNVQGLQCAVLHVHSRLPLTLPRELAEGFAREGVDFQGWIETDMEQCFALDMGWPIRGEGHTAYDTKSIKDGETVSHTTFHLDVSFEVPL